MVKTTQAFRLENISLSAAQHKSVGKKQNPDSGACCAWESSFRIFKGQTLSRSAVLKICREKSKTPRDIVTLTERKAWCPFFFSVCSCIFLFCFLICPSMIGYIEIVIEDEFWCIPIKMILNEQRWFLRWFSTSSCIQGDEFLSSPKNQIPNQGSLWWLFRYPFCFATKVKEQKNTAIKAAIWFQSFHGFQRFFFSKNIFLYMETWRRLAT